MRSPAALSLAHVAAQPRTPDFSLYRCAALLPRSDATAQYMAA